MKGIILAGGRGSRLYPITRGTSKQLIPVYDKPMIYYPISILMLAGIKEILIISTSWHLKKFQDLLGDGSDLNIKFEYKIQENPNGLAEAFILGEDFIGNDDVCLILGDNIIYGQGIIELLSNAEKIVEHEQRAVIFGYTVSNPEDYGVIEFDDVGRVYKIIEKPKNSKSDQAAIGLYFYPNDVIKIAKETVPSERGELEITSVNQKYLDEDRLKVIPLGRGYAWFDAGTHDSLLDASNFIYTVEKRQGLKISCIEEIAFEMGYINKEELLALSEPLKKNEYGKYLIKRASKK